MKKMNRTVQESHNLVWAAAIVIGLIVTAYITLAGIPFGTRAAASCGSANTACCWIRNSSGGYSPSCNAGLSCAYNTAAGANLCVGAVMPTAAYPTPLPTRVGPTGLYNPTPAPTAATGSGCGGLGQACCWVKNSSGGYSPSCKSGSCKWNAARNGNFCN